MSERKLEKQYTDSKLPLDFLFPIQGKKLVKNTSARALSPDTKENVKRVCLETKKL